MSARRRWWPRVAVSVAGALGVLAVAGCVPTGSDEPEAWAEAEDAVMAELSADAWLDGTPGAQDHDPYGYARPSVSREGAAVGEEPWRDAAAEVAGAEAAGWVAVFVTCSAPEGMVQVDLVQELSSGVATARIVAPAFTPGQDSPVEVSAVAPHHLDGDWVRRPDTTPPQDFDAGSCLHPPGDQSEAGYDPRWSGTPVMYDLTGDSPPPD